MQENSVETKIFVCPFNGYHKLFDYRKFKFHIARCKDRRGKNVYTCQHHSSHIYVDVNRLLEHEKECEFRPATDTKTEKKEEDDQSKTEPGSPEQGFSELLNGRQPPQRQPTTTYCLFNCEHVFKTLEQRVEHEKVCPQRSDYERKMEHSQKVYQKHKVELKKSQQNRKSQFDEFYGHNNCPTAADMPTLHYKYKMNEPFLAGESGQYQVSHEQNQFKKKFVYGLGREVEPTEADLTEAQKLDNFKREREQEFNLAFAGKPAPDVTTLVIRDESQRDLFGLQIDQKMDPRVNHLFEFDTETRISLTEFCEKVSLPAEAISKWDETQWKGYLRQAALITLSLSKRNPEWQEASSRLLNEHAKMASFEEDPLKRKTILVNKSRAFQVLERSGQSSDLHQSAAADILNTESFLFLIDSSTEHLGQFLESDFLLLGITTKREAQAYDTRHLSPEIATKLEMSSLLSHPQAHKLKFNKAEWEVEKQELEQRLKDATETITAMQADQETSEKIIRDRERQSRQDKKQIEFLEGDRKGIRGELRHLEESLGGKDIDIRNREKDLEQFKMDIKSLQMRFEREKVKSDSFQERHTKTSVELQKARELLTNANKAIKHKDIAMGSKDQEITKLKTVVQQFSTLKDGSQVMSGAPMIQLTAPSQQPVTVQLIKTDTTSAAAAVTQSGASVAQAVAVEEDLAPFGEVSDGEIIDDAEEAHGSEVIKMNKAQYLAEQTLLRSKCKHPHSHQHGRNPEEQKSASQRALIENDEFAESGAGSLNASKAKQQKDVALMGKDIPEEILCVVCMHNRRSVMIQTCKHLVFCYQCDLEYKLKNLDHLECPICRKEYRKTIPILYA